MFKLNSSVIKGVFEIEAFFHGDNRGGFTKTFQSSLFEAKGIRFNLKESYYSKSAKNVIRGMHFQRPPHEHHKIVYCPHGTIIDVVLDMRRKSPTYGEYFSCQLSANNHKALFIPEGCAHGFKTLSEGALTIYLVSSEYHKESDTGVLWNSFGFNWDCEQPVISTRDKGFKRFANFASPF